MLGSDPGRTRSGRPRGEWYQRACSRPPGDPSWGPPVGLVVVQTFEATASGEPRTTLQPFAHLGFDVDDPAEEDAMADLGRAEGYLHCGAKKKPRSIGCLCALSNPDGMWWSSGSVRDKEAFGS